MANLKIRTPVKMSTVRKCFVLFLIATSVHAQNDITPLKAAPEDFRGFSLDMSMGRAITAAENQQLTCRAAGPDYIWCEGNNNYRVLQYYDGQSISENPLIMLRFLLYPNDGNTYETYLREWRSILGEPVMFNNTEKWAFWHFSNGTHVVFREEIRHGSIAVTINDICPAGRHCWDECDLRAKIRRDKGTICVINGANRECDSSAAIEQFTAIISRSAQQSHSTIH
ncbi:MAG: hypothetical protein KDK34_17450 [Leptospiraceae bacterium]|nr:hypothetical protein [Leptospiraceae bacterium]MCB1322048.1 hypothetical protein [Leptospiraceae bacterium]